MNAQETLAQIASEVSVCKNCDLHKNRIMSVPGEGPADAEIMLIGEGPGATEEVDQQQSLRSVTVDEPPGEQRTEPKGNPPNRAQYPGTFLPDNELIANHLFDAR